MTVRPMSFSCKENVNAERSSDSNRNQMVIVIRRRKTVVNSDYTQNIMSRSYNHAAFIASTAQDAS